MEKLRSAEQFSELANNESVVFMFTAGWCPDCRIIDPVMPEVESKYPEYRFISVDRDEFIDVCAENDIYGIPSFLGYRGGTERGRFVSRDRKTQEEIESFISGLSK